MRLWPLAGILLLVGCAGGDFRTPLSAELLARCLEDGQSRWLESPGEIENILVLGEVRDPASTNGLLVPKVPLDYSLYAERWLQRPGMKSVDLYLEPHGHPASPHLFEPRSGQPTGVYRFKKAPADDPGCEEYKTTFVARAKLSHLDYSKYPTQECIVRKYVGPLSPYGDQILMVWYFDSTLDDSSIMRIVTEIRRGEHTVIGRTVLYQYHGYVVGPDCFRKSGDRELFYREASALTIHGPEE
ncbi:MAG: hypothetical protein Q7T19_13955 [Caulobacter sp.]|nr:hypothetical protein [Caulobacter sp.]